MSDNWLDGLDVPEFDEVPEPFERGWTGVIDAWRYDIELPIKLWLVRHKIAPKEPWSNITTWANKYVDIDHLGRTGFVKLDLSNGYHYKIIDNYTIGDLIRKFWIYDSVVPPCPPDCQACVLKLEWR